ncbi:phosphotransferase [Candidatus Vidania fulgoroideae]|nr:phosphotransferase [Candidatus Vidania fulgoroideae]
MAVFFKNKKKIKEEIIKNYNLNIKDIKNINEGTDNSNYLVKTNKLDFILTIFEKIKIKNINKCLNFMIILNLNGIKTPRQIYSKKKKRILYFKKKPYSIFSKIIGTKINKTNRLHIYIIGNLLAKIHKITLKKVDFYIENRNNFYNIKKKFKKIRKKINEEYKFLIENEIIFHEMNMKNNKKTRHCICHSDLFRDNIFFNKKQKYINGIIDFYFSGYEYLISDISIIINDWCIKNNKIEKNKILILIRSYIKKNSLNKKEINNLNTNMRYIALRFLVTRIYDIKIKKKIKEYKNKKINTFKNILYKHIKNEFFYKKKYKK